MIMPNAHRATIYVSPSGSASNPGTLVAPVATLAQAQMLARRLSGADVILRGGTYRLTQTLTLTATDSDTAWKAYPGEAVSISGGVTLTGWSLDDTRKGIWRCTAPAGSDFRQIYVNGTRCVRARSTDYNAVLTRTETGYSISPDSPLIDLARPDDLEFNLPFTYASMRVPVRSIDASGSITLQPESWASSAYDGYFTVAAGQQPFCVVNALGQPVWIENALEFLSPSTPGQFYLDKMGGSVYYVPRAGEDMQTASVSAPMVETLIQLSGTVGAPVRDVTFTGLTFSHTIYAAANTVYGVNLVQNATSDYLSPGGVAVGATGNNTAYTLPSAVQVLTGRDIAFESCTWEHLGSSGLTLCNGSQHITLSGCTMRDISGQGITAGTEAWNPPDPDLINSGLTVTDCLFDTCGAEFYTSMGCGVYWVRDFVCEHNEFSNMPYAGVTYGGVTHDQTFVPNINSGGSGPGSSISHNLFTDCMQLMDDGGSIYAQGMFDPNHPLKVSRNVVTGNARGYGALYPDTGAANCDMRNNIVYSCPSFVLNSNTTGNPDLIHTNEAVLRYNFCDAKNYHQGTTDGATDMFRNNQGDLSLGSTMPASVLQSAGRRPAFGGTVWDNSGAPGPPRDVTLTEQASDGGATPLDIAWSAPGSGGVSGYEVAVTGTGLPRDGLIVFCGDASTHSYSWRDVTPGATYTVTIRARNTAAQMSEAATSPAITISAEAAPQDSKSYPIWQD